MANYNVKTPADIIKLFITKYKTWEYISGYRPYGMYGYTRALTIKQMNWLDSMLMKENRYKDAFAKHELMYFEVTTVEGTQLTVVYNRTAKINNRNCPLRGSLSVIDEETRQKVAKERYNR